MMFFSYRYSRLWRKLNNAKRMMTLSNANLQAYTKIGEYLTSVGLLHVHLQEMKSTASQTLAGKEVVFVSGGAVEAMKTVSQHYKPADGYADSLEFSHTMPTGVFLDLRKQLEKEIGKMMGDVSMKIDMEFSQSLLPRYQNHYYRRLYRAVS